MYLVAVSQQTFDDPAWRAVAETLAARYGGEVMTYSGVPFPVTLRGALAARRPEYVCFVAQPLEVTQAYVASAHQMLRQLDSDPYGDAVWGVVTGLAAADAQSLANKAGPLVIRKALMKTAGDWLDYLQSGTYHSETDTGAVWTRAAGGAIVKSTDGPLDDTVTLVDALNANDIGLMVTSGHASEYNWQLHYPTASPEGYFTANAGQLYGYDSGASLHAVSTSNEKVYYAPGNCLIGHIPEDSGRVNCMALAWLKSGGAAQMAGYTVTTAYGYMGWGVSEYLLKLQDRWTFAESCHLNNQALLFDGLHGTPGVSAAALEHDRDVFVLYGDPAYDARVAAVTQPDYAQTLTHAEDGGVVSFTLTVTMNRAVNVPRPVIARLPFRVSNAQVTGDAGRAVDVVDDMALVNIWHEGESSLYAGQTWTATFTARAEGACACHPADINCDWRITLSEVVAYLAGWQRGEHPMAQAIRAAYIWQARPCYTCSAGDSEPLRWVPVPCWQCWRFGLKSKSGVDGFHSYLT